jgi:hypothetical protein
VDAYERDVIARMDADVGMVTAQGQQFQQQFNAMAAAWQPMPPYMFAQYADGLARWVAYFRQAAGPAADWLARAGRPVAAQRLAAIVDDMIKAEGTYRQMAGQQVAHLSALTQATTQSNREVADIWAATHAAQVASYDRMNAAMRSVL